VTAASFSFTQQPAPAIGDDYLRTPIAGMKISTQYNHAYWWPGQLSLARNNSNAGILTAFKMVTLGLRRFIFWSPLLRIPWCLTFSSTRTLLSILPQNIIWSQERLPYCPKLLSPSPSGCKSASRSFPSGDLNNYSAAMLKSCTCSWAEFVSSITSSIAHQLLGSGSTQIIDGENSRAHRHANARQTSACV
jgi:hypothetical protein